MIKEMIEFNSADIYYIYDEYDILNIDKLTKWRKQLALITPKKCYVDDIEAPISPDFSIFDSYGLPVPDATLEKINPNRYSYFQASFSIESTDFHDSPSTYLYKDFPLTPTNMNSLMAAFNYMHNLTELLDIKEIEEILNYPTQDNFKLGLSTVAVFTESYLKPSPGFYMPPMYKIKQIGALTEHKITYFVADTNGYGSKINEKCLLELFGMKIFYPLSPKENKKDILTGWKQLLKHLDIPSPIIKTDSHPEYYAKSRLKSLGVKFPEDIF